MPFIATGAFWISLKFDNWRRDIKNNIEDKQLLSLEQSIEIREEVRKQSDRYAQMLSDKDKEIDSLKSLLETMQRGGQSTTVDAKLSKRTRESVDEKEYYDEYRELSRKSVFINYFHTLVKKIQDGEILTGGRFSGQALTFFNANDIIAKSGNMGVYDFTEKGRFFLRHYVNEIN